MTLAFHNFALAEKGSPLPLVITRGFARSIKYVPAFKRHGRSLEEEDRLSFCTQIGGKSGFSDGHLADKCTWLYFQFGVKLSSGDNIGENGAQHWKSHYSTFSTSVNIVAMNF